MHILMYGFLRELPKHDGRIADVIGKLVYVAINRVIYISKVIS